LVTVPSGSLAVAESVIFEPEKKLALLAGAVKLTEGFKLPDKELYILNSCNSRLLQLFTFAVV
jgi:hypothetical protein